MHHSLRLTGQRNVCPACNQKFARNIGFERHRTGTYGDRRCRTVAEMTSIGMSLGADGFWRGPSKSTERPAHWSK